MDTDVLLQEICKRVQEKLQSMEQETLPSILVLTEEHGNLCHETLENSRLCQYYRMDCALLAEYQCSVKDYEAVVVYTLSNEALGNISHGIFDNGFTRLFGQALLEGKKIYVSSEGIELYRYQETAPKAFYQRLEENLELLRQSGVVILPHSKIPDQILHGQEAECPCKTETEADKQPVSLKEEQGEISKTVLDKKIITEKDLIPLGHKHVRQVVVREKSILSDLAKEYAAKHNILIKRREISSGKRE